MDFESDVVISLSDHVDRCGETHDFFTRWSEASEALLAASEEGKDGAAYCEAMPEFLAAIDAAAAAQPQVGKVLSVSLCSTCDSIDGAVVIGHREIGGVSLSLDTEAEPNPLANRFDADQCGAAALEEGEGPAAWWFEDGTADLTADLFGAYSGTLEARGGEAFGAEAENIDTLEVGFTTALCAAPEVARLVLY